MTGELENVSCNNCGKDIPRLLFVKRGLRIVKCSNCGLVYTNPRVKRNHAQNIYNSAYFKSCNSIVSGYEDYLKEQQTIEATFRKRIDFILSNAPSILKINNPRILDVGCAMGFLLRLFDEIGWQAEGVEFSQYASSYAVSKLNLNVKCGILNELHLENEHYDLITCWDVIEHLYNPIDDIKRMNQLLKIGGYIAIITPNRDSIHARFVGSRWVEYDKPEEHLYFFGENNLKQILYNLGFQTVATTYAGKYVSLKFAFNRLRSYSKLFGLISTLLGKKASERYIYINPYDKMFLLARKYEIKKS